MTTSRWMTLVLLGTGLATGCESKPAPLIPKDTGAAAPKALLPSTPKPTPEAEAPKKPVELEAVALKAPPPDVKAALAKGKELLSQAQFKEAEVQLRIASEGNLSEADPLLYKARLESAAIDHIASAQTKFEAKKWLDARAELDQVGPDSAIYAKVEELRSKISLGEEAEKVEFAAKAAKALEARLADGGAAKPTPTP